MSNSGHPVLLPLRDPVAEPLRRGQQLRVRLVIEQVEEQRIGELVVRPGRLAHAARPEQEEALLRGRLEQSRIQKRLGKSVLLAARYDVRDHALQLHRADEKVAIGAGALLHDCPGCGARTFFRSPVNLKGTW